MARNWEFNETIPYTAQKVFETVTDPKFIEEWTWVLGGENPNCTVVEKTEHRLLTKLVYEEPLPMGIGVIKATMTTEWDVAQRFSTWIRKSEGVGARARVEGTTKIIENDDESCQFLEKGVFDIPIPVIGRKLEKNLVEHLKKNRKKKIEALLGKLERRS